MTVEATLMTKIFPGHVAPPCWAIPAKFASVPTMTWNRCDANCNYSCASYAEVNSFQRLNNNLLCSPLGVKKLVRRTH
jgi:hypothetical protein